ncbi:MAG: CGGC domain-containing protein [Desulfobulbaceae bacterium]|nr:CGGC domain-containing protein [Desulfobulbaceae bacterium]
MEKILIVGCKNTMDDVCIGCSRCLVAFNRRQGVFEIYRDTDAEIVGMIGCGGCPAPAIITRLMQVKLWNAPMNEKPTVIHIAPCVAEQCPYKDEIIRKIAAKSAIRVIEGTHPYVPTDIFA